MKVLILAAGYGTRLYPIVKDTPKPLLKIHGTPLIDYLVEKVKDFKGLSEILVVTNNKFYADFCKWSKGFSGLQAKVTVVNDGTNTPDDRLGSIGDIEFVLEHQNIQEDLFVLGGDNLFDYRLDEFVVFSQTQSPNVSIGLYDIKQKDEATRFGVVELCPNSRKVLSFEEKPAQPRSTLIAMCSYYFPHASLGLLREYLDETQKADKAGDYIHWLVAKKEVYGFQFEGSWYDIGSVESLKEAQSKFKP